MARRLPSLNALRAFEAAARHLSFTKAADELNVTQAAISHQVKGLEDWLGVKLFRRLNRALRLTEEGQDYVPAISDALDGLDAATRKLLRGDAARTLTVTTMDSFAADWLVPRLKRFRVQHPEIEVRVTTSDRLVDFSREDVDMAIRYGRGRYPGMQVDRLMKEDIFPVCSPELLQGPHPLRTPADLQYHTLLHDDMTVNWEAWLKFAGIEGVDASRGPFFQHSYLVRDAALLGEGVALGRGALVADALADGRLVRPFDISLPAEYAYYVVCPETAAETPKNKAFREWLLAEAAETMSKPLAG
ncbi:MAG: transcriptional regulator GcvA [Alphaproteobacteria bacterium]|nr:transcriptional regulator GcvA [Alphaproteobacteria bacterium]